VRVPSGALGLIAAIVAVGLIGAAIDAGFSDVAEIDDVLLSDERFESSTRLCPPSISGGGAVWVATGEEPARVAFEPEESEATAVERNSLLRHAAPEEALSVVGYDAPVTAAASYAFAEGAGAASCASRASDLWYFAQGSTENEFAQRIILYNPFPEEASVRITLYLENRTRAPSRLSDIPVPGSSHAVVNFVPNTSPSYGKVGAEVAASRGRIVAWRSMIVRGENRPQGTEFSLGTSEPSTEWYFPTAVVDDTTFTNVRVLNPSEDEASVRVALLTSNGRIEHPSLEDIVIPPTSAHPLDLERVLQREEIPEKFGVIVESSVPVVAERTIGSTGVQPGRSSEIGATEAFTRWTLPPVAAGARDDTLTVMNPGNAGADVQVVLTRVDGAPLEPDRLQVRVARGRTIELALDTWQGEAPFAAVVTSSAPVVVERSAQFEGDRSSAMGIPTG
jgi:hypothetical protein